MRLSIIIPVYKVENYFRACLESILSQPIPKEEYEIIAVDDGTPDRSFESVSDLIQRYNKTIRIIHQINSGPSVARNNGFDVAKGNYVFFMDSDDCLIPNTLSILLDIAERNNVDMLRADYMKLEDNQIQTYLDSEKVCNIDFDPVVSTGQEAIVHHNTRECYSWMNIFRREFIKKHSIRYVPKMIFEDVALTMECYLRANRFCFVPLKFYIYRQQNNSLLHKMSKNDLLSLNLALRLLCNLRSEIPMTVTAKKKIDDTIFDTMSIGLWYLSHFNNLYPHRMEIINDLKEKMPQLWFCNSLKQRLISICLNISPLLYIESTYRFSKRKY